MCRLFAYAGPGEDLAAHLTADGASLRTLACDHSHGWGVAAWSGPNAAAWVAKAPMAADKDDEFRRAASLRAPRVLAHIRKASSGVVGLSNTHPFARGRWGFAHNGTIYGMDFDAEMATVDEDLRVLRGGSTDSEVAFLLFLTELRRHGGENAPLEAAADALRTVARRLRERYPGTAKPTRLNFLAGNGDGFVATRWIHDLSMRTTPESAFLASVPMGRPEGWKEVPDGSVLVVRPGRIDVRPL